MRPVTLEPATRMLALISVIAGILMVTLLPAHAGLLSLRAKAVSALGAAFLTNSRCVDFIDVAQNILLFLPFGYLIATFVPPRRGVIIPQAMAFLAGLCLSAAVEILQAWIPGRFPSLTDVVLNGAGAWCGGMAAACLAGSGAGQS